jgi:hypothetical protein
MKKEVKFIDFKVLPQFQYENEASDSPLVIALSEDGEIYVLDLHSRSDGFIKQYS